MLLKFDLLVWEVPSIMAAAALTPGQRTLRNQFRQRVHIAKLESRARRIMDLMHTRLERRYCRCQPRSVADNAATIPHQATNFRFRCKRERDMRRAAMCCRGSRGLAHGAARARSEDDALEQRIARQAIRAVYAGARDLA